MINYLSFNHKRGIILLVSAILLLWGCRLHAESQLPLDEIVKKVEQHYSASGFHARFDQQSTIKAMQITDTATGRIYVKRPDKMRWEYDFPEKQTVVTDGRTLWIYRPEDNQVMVGKAPEYFGGGKGASFLSDIKTIRTHFSISLEKPDDRYYQLKLIPRQTGYDLTSIGLSVSKDTFDIVEIITLNSYLDRTRISLTHIAFDDTLNDSLFTLIIPEGTDVLELEE